MKKILSIMLACVLVVSMATFVNADDKKVAEFIYGTPTIDGEIEAMWEYAPKHTVNELSAGTTLTDSYATFRGMWDNTNNLYFLIEVYDTTPYYLDTTHKCDNAELAFDPFVNEAYSYEEDPTSGKLNFGAHNDSPVGISKGTWDPSWYERVVTYTDTGWNMEVRVDFGSYNGIKLVEGMDFGFDIMIGDYPAEENASRTCGIGWNDLSDSSWQYPFVLGLIHLIKVDVPVVEETEVETEAAAEETEAVEETEAAVEETEAETEEVVEAAEAVVEETKAPQTFDAAIIAGVAAVVSLAGYAISKKR